MSSPMSEAATTSRNSCFVSLPFPECTPSSPPGPTPPRCRPTTPRLAILPTPSIWPRLSSNSRASLGYSLPRYSLPLCSRTPRPRSSCAFSASTAGLPNPHPPPRFLPDCFCPPCWPAFSVSPSATPPPSPPCTPPPSGWSTRAVSPDWRFTQSAKLFNFHRDRTYHSSLKGRIDINLQRG